MNTATSLTEVYMDHKRQKRGRLHSVESAAEFLGGVGESTVRGWLREGKLSRVKVGRLTRVWEHELLALIRTQPKGGTHA